MSSEKKTIRSDIPGHQSYLASVPVYGADESRRMIVGRGITLNGKISACDHMVIDGTFEGEGFAARRLDILEHGLFKGSAEVVDAVISGRFEGSLVVTGRLGVRAGGHITGEVSYGSLETENGARIEGKVAVLPPSMVTPAAEPEKQVKKPMVIRQQAPFSNIETIYDAPKAVVRDAADEGDSEGEATDGKSPRVFRRAVGF